jgi:hypothetical protein
MTQEQADRLKKAIEAEGFTEVALEAIEKGQSLAVSVKAGDKTLRQVADDPSNLALVVHNLKNQRQTQANEGKDLAQGSEGK